MVVHDAHEEGPNNSCSPPQELFSAATSSRKNYAVHVSSRHGTITTYLPGEWWSCCTYVVSVHLLFLIELRSLFVDTRAVVNRVATEGHVEILEELITSSQQRLRRVGMSINTRLAVKHNDTVGEVGGHDEVMLDDESRTLGVHDEALDDSSGDDTLLRIKVRRRFVNEVDFRRRAESENNGHTLQFTTRQVLDFLIDKVFQLERLDNIGLELRREECLLNLLEEELADSTFKLRGNSLWFVGDIHAWHRALAVWFDGASKETAESGLASTILPHHDDDLRVCEVTGINSQSEVAKRLLHLRVLEGARLVNGVLFGTLGDAEGQRLFTESQVFRRDVTVEEDVDAFADRVRQSDDTIDSRPAVENTDVVREIIQNGQIVLNHNDVVIVAKKRAYNLSSTQSLLDIKVGRWLVEHVNICLLDADGSDGETLQLSARKQVDITVHDVVQLQDI